MREAISRRGRGLVRDQRGFTMVEGVVAAMLLTIGVLAVLQSFDAGTRNTFRAEQSQVINDRLQAELEAIRELPYQEIALSSLPAAVSGENDPRSRISGTQFALERGGGSPAQLVYDGGINPGGGGVTSGSVNPAPTPFEAGDVSGEIYRFVTWSSDPSCADCAEGSLKRIVVAASVAQGASTFDRTYQEVHTDVVDPDAVPLDPDNPNDDPQDPGNTTASFWLTDTTCNNASRQPLTGDHPTHNTRGICSQGLQTGNNRGAPDLMHIAAPEQVTVPEGEPQPTYDYATDSEPATGGSSDIGILMPKLSGGCLLNGAYETLTGNVRKLLDGTLSLLSLNSAPTSVSGVLDILDGTDKQKKVHTWVSPPTTEAGGVLLGNGNLDLYTRTINGATYGGKICVFLSVRQSVTVPYCLINLLGICLGQNQTTIEVDLPVVNTAAIEGGDCAPGLTYFEHSQNPWPKTWEDGRISIPLCFAMVDANGVPLASNILPIGSRIVLSVMVDNSGTGGAGLEFMYDVVGFESRLELESNALIPF